MIIEILKGGKKHMKKCIKLLKIAYTILYISLVVLFENTQKIYNTFKMLVLIISKDYKKAYYTRINGKLKVTLIY